MTQQTNDSTSGGHTADEQGPTANQLAEIEQEWPLIEAELELLDIQLTILSGTGRVDELEVRRLRHARRAVIRESLAWYELRASGAETAA